MARIETVGVLARLQLGARRAGIELRLRRAPSNLVDLIALCGLTDALRVEVERQAEAGEDGGGVEEERELGDLPT